MDVFVRSIPDQTTQTQLYKFFQPVLAKFSIHTYRCEKLKGRGCAILTILDERSAREFLNVHGSVQGKPTAVQLFVLGRPIICTLSRNEPDKFLVLSLEKEEADRRKKSKNKEHATDQTVILDRKFDFYQLSSGIWDYDDAELVFVAYFQDNRRGTAMFGTKSLTLLIRPWSKILPSIRIDIPYSSIQTVTTAGQPEPTITFTLMEAPRI